MFQMCGADLIVLYLVTLCMICTINFYYQLGVETYKINNVVAENMLPPKVHSQVFLP